MRSDTYAVLSEYSRAYCQNHRTQHLMYETVNANLTQTCALYQVISADGITCLL